MRFDIFAYPPPPPAPLGSLLMPWPPPPMHSIVFAALFQSLGTVHVGSVAVDVRNTCVAVALWSASAAMISNRLVIGPLSSSA